MGSSGATKKKINIRAQKENLPRAAKAKASACQNAESEIRGEVIYFPQALNHILKLCCDG